MGTGQYTLPKEDQETIMKILVKNKIYYDDGLREVGEDGIARPFHTTRTTIVICDFDDEHEEYKPYVQIER